MLLTPSVSTTGQVFPVTKPYTILVLCTGNSARSIMAEALFNHSGHPWFHAVSAGSHPVGRVNPFALEQIATLGVPEVTYRSKSWHEFNADSGQDIDFVMTVCGNAAEEQCPVLNGHALRIHWGFPDPAAEKSSEQATRDAFSACFNTLKTRIEALMTLDLEIKNHQEIAQLMAAQAGDHASC